MTNKIVISGYYGFDNFGDEIILKILTENIKKYIPSAQITVFSVNPRKTSANLGVNSVHSFKLFNVVKEILNSHTLISGGGSLLQDITSAKSLIYYLCIILSAVIFRKKIIIFAQGFGPIKNKFLLQITTYLLRQAKYITVRDNISLNQLKQLKITAEQCFDPVWNINLKEIPKENKLGIQLRQSKLVNDNFLNTLAYSVSENFFDKKISLLSLQNIQDLDVCKKFKEELLQINGNLNIEIIENTSNEKMIEEISKCSEIISMRYHACLIAIKCGIKLLPLNYDIKVETLAKEFNLDYIDLNNTSNLNEKVRNFKSNQIKYNIEEINMRKFDFPKLSEKISQ